MKLIANGGLWHFIPITRASLTARPRRFLRKYKSDKDPNFVAQLPDLAPGSLGSCAIIGNADNLLRHRWGREIDMHDFVVRFNVKMKVRQGSL